MTKNKFLEKYPEFEGYSKTWDNSEDKWAYNEEIIEEILDKYFIRLKESGQCPDCGHVCLRQDKYISKEKVKDAIDKLTKFEYGADSLYEKALMDLLKELGLE